MEPALQGEVRRLPASPAWRVLQAVTLWLLCKTVLLLVLRVCAGYHRRFALSFYQGVLQLHIERRAFGKVLSQQNSALQVRGLHELTFKERGEDPAFFVGLAALALGTFLGSRLLTEGLLVSGVSLWLLGGGSLLVAASLCLDFVLGSGRTRAHPRGRAELILRADGARGWVLSAEDPKAAQELFQTVRRQLEELPGTARKFELTPDESSSDH